MDTSKAKTSLEALKISIRQLKWKECPVGRRLPCDIYWHGGSFYESENLCSGQVNKFPGMTEMVRKINLSRAVRTMQELYPEDYDFYPQSWILPEEYHVFTAEGCLCRRSLRRSSIWHSGDIRGWRFTSRCGLWRSSVSVSWTRWMRRDCCAAERWESRGERSAPVAGQTCRLHRIRRSFTAPMLPAN